LACDRHDNYVGFSQVVSLVADYNCRTLLECRLIGKWKSHQDNITEFIGHRKRRLPDWPKQPRKQGHSPIPQHV